MSIAINENGIIKEIGIKTYDGFQITGYKCLLDKHIYPSDSDNHTDVLPAIDLYQYTFLLIIASPYKSGPRNTSFFGDNIIDCRAIIETFTNNPTYSYYSWALSLITMSCVDSTPTTSFDLQRAVTINFHPINNDCHNVETAWRCSTEMGQSLIDIFGIQTTLNS